MDLESRNKSEERISLINEMVFLTGLQEKLWKYHPNNQDKVNVVDEYAQLQMDIDDIERKIEKLNKAD